MTNSRDPSRRDFLAASAIGLIGLARGAESPALRDEVQTDGDLLYVGTYTEGGRSRDLSPPHGSAHWQAATSRLGGCRREPVLPRDPPQRPCALRRQRARE